MSFTEQEIQRIFKKYKEVFEEMEHYDQTLEKLWKKKRIDVTLTLRLIKKLKQLGKQTGKPVSHILEEAVEKMKCV
ncbi:TPA: ribbon-helix-helix domain-containing protein [Candidatus Woesearchaeota archaeon]|nr:ribbon-helix-helix domain-containing protein [Candidatus Woesearchaeota archaeon]